MTSLFAPPHYQLAADNSLLKDAYRTIVIGGMVLLVFYLYKRNAMRRFANWANIRSDAEGLSKFIHELGVSNAWQFVDVLGLDDEGLAMVPEQCLAFVLLMPITPSRQKRNREEYLQLRQELPMEMDDIYFLRQTVNGACGTIGVLHAIANKADDLELRPDSTISVFLKETQDSLIGERTSAFNSHKKIRKAHDKCAGVNTTRPRPSRSSRSSNPATSRHGHHYTTFVCKYGTLYQLDGQKPFPIPCGGCPIGEFKSRAARRIRELMDQDPRSSDFALLALVPK